MKNLLIAASAIALLLLWACHLEPNSGETTLNIEGDAAWSEFSTVIVEVRDLQGNVIDTLYNGHLDGVSDLKNLPAGEYQGGDAIFAILGFKGDTLVFEQTRKFKESDGTAEVETTLAVGAPIRTFKAVPETLRLWLGGPDTVVKASVIPAFAKPRLAWTYDKEAIEVAWKDGSGEVRVKTRQAGKSSLTLFPEGLDSLASRIGIEIVADAPRLAADPAKLSVAPGAEVEFGVKSSQEYGDVKMFQWDLDGDGGWDDSLAGQWTGKEVDLPRQKKTFASAGKYTVRFRARDSEGNHGECVSLIEVGERRPTVDLLPKDTVISIKDEIRFTASISEPGGRLTGYGWDWNGDGKADDEATLNDSIASLLVTRVFNDTGSFRIVLRAKDAGNKVGADSVTITVDRDAPVVSAGAAVTAKTNVPVSFGGMATQKFGTIAIYKWDFDGDQAWDDSSKAPPAMTHAFSREAEYTARLLARDDDGNETIATRKVTISDVPFVITAMREDTSVSIKDAVEFFATVRNDDGKALVYNWDWNGDGKFDDTTATNKAEFTAKGNKTFAAAGRFRVLFRVQDVQGKTLTDSTIVTVALDAPRAILGKDDTVLTGATVAIKLLDSQNHGTIAKRELQIGSDTAWIPLSRSDTTLAMPLVKGVVRVVGRVTDDDGLTGLDTIEITVNYPMDSHLSGIFLSSGTLVPSFNSDILSYTVSYAYNATTVQVGGAARDPKATVSVNGTRLTGAVTSVAVPLSKVGSNIAIIVVTAQDTAVKRTYSLSLDKAPPPITTLSKLVPSAGVLSPAFSASTFSYALAVPDSVDTLRFTPTLSDTQARVTVSGLPVATGSPSQKLPLKIGQTKYDLAVTSGVGTGSTYSVTVTRNGWSLSGVAGFANASHSLQTIVAENGTAYVGALDGATPSKVNVWKGDAGVWTNIVAGSIRDSSGGSLGMDIIAGVPWMTSVSYHSANPAFNINTRKYVSGTNWTLMGKPVTGGYGAMEMNLGHTKSNQPFMAYHYSYTVQTLFLFKHVDTAWHSQTGGNFDSVSNLRMVVNPANGYPTLAYVRGGSTTSFRANLFHYTGTAYASLTFGWPTANARIDIACDSAGATYYAYLDPSSKKIAVRKYASGTWSDLGPAAGFSEGEASSICIAAMGTTPIVAYRDSKLATVAVKQWTGSAWTDFGGTDFTLPDVTTVRLAVDQTGVWVAYTDVATVQKISVMRRPLP